MNIKNVTSLKSFTTSLMLSTLVFASIHQNALASRWKRTNGPEKMAAETGGNFVYNMNSLPKEGALTQKPWADDYWATYKRGLAHRWKGPLIPVKHPDETEEEFNVRKSKDKGFTEKEILAMSEEERDKLSPAEKFDILNGDYSYSLYNAEMDRTTPDAPTWEGICHGWAPAAMLFEEPGSCKVGIGPGNFLTGQAQLPFSSSDIKGVLSLMQGNFNDNADHYFVGTRCDDKMAEIEWDKSSHKNDINAGAFHIILANRIGLLNKGFVFDRTVDAEVWNQPVEAFKTTVLGETAPDPAQAAPGTVKELHVETVVSYTEEVDPHREKLNDKDRSGFVVNQPYKYTLELDAHNNIIGGRWEGNDYPDFVWSQSKGEFVGPFKNFKKVYNKATKKWLPFL